MARPGHSASRRYHDRVASRYEQTYGDAYWQWHDELTWAYLKPFLPTDANAAVVDLGCGPGKWGRKLLKTGYPVTFVDLSAKMLDQARRHVAEAGSMARATFLQADLTDLSALPAEHFALATAMGEPIGCSEKPGQALKQIARVLAPGAMLVATFDNRVAGIDYYLDKDDPEGLEEFLRTGRTNWLTRDPAERFVINMFEPDQLRTLLSRMGWEVVDMVGKTVLPMRRHRDQLADPARRRRWAKIEKRLARDPANLARCAHVQIAARKQTGE